MGVGDRHLGDGQTGFDGLGRCALAQPAQDIEHMLGTGAACFQHELDRDQDGLISYEEFIEAIGPRDALER